MGSSLLLLRGIWKTRSDGGFGNDGLGNLSLGDDYPGIGLLLPIGHVLFLKEK